MNFTIPYKNQWFLVVFGLTNRPKIIQNHEKTRSKNRLVFGIDFGPLFLTFGLPKAPKSAPKCSQNAPKCVATLRKNHFFGHQNDHPGLQNRPQNDPWRPNSAPQTISYHRLPKTFNKYRNRQHNFNFTSYTSHFPRPTFKLRTSHFALCTSHLIHFTQHSPAVCAKRLNNR